MKLSTTLSKKILVIGFWLIIWQIGSVLIGSSILLASPLEVTGRIGSMVQTAPFWFTIINSFFRIMLGFVLGFTAGVLLASMCYRFSFFYDLFSPVLALIKSIPVASFIILLLVWVDSRFLSTVVGFLIVLPVVFENMSRGLKKMDKNMLEMSRVFNVPFNKRLRYLYFSSLQPYILTAVSVGTGFCFKSGVAAEVIGICRNTIGEAIYMSKINLETADVLAWTVVIVLLSSFTDRLTRRLVTKAEKGVKSCD